MLIAFIVFCVSFWCLLIAYLYSVGYHDERLRAMETEKEKMDVFCDYQLRINDLAVERLIEIEEELQISKEDTHDSLIIEQEESTEPGRLQRVTRELEVFEDKWS